MKPAICFTLLLVLLLGSSISDALACNLLKLTVSGTLAHDARSEDIASPNATGLDTISVRLPLENLGANDSEAVVFVKPTGPQSWTVELKNTLKESFASDTFTSTVTMLSFSEKGDLLSPQSFSLQPFSGNVDSAESRVEVIFEDIRQVPGESDLRIAHVEKETAKCSPFGRLDESHEVNGGADNELTRGIEGPPEELWKILSRQ